MNRTSRRSPIFSAVEALESRVFLSGVVSASVVDGTLLLRGDSAGNTILVDQTSLNAQQVRITGGNGTTINSNADPLILSGVTRGITIQMGNAADDVTLQDINLHGNISVDGRNGANTLTFNNVSLSGNLNISNIAQGSTTAIGTATVGGNLNIAGGAGTQHDSLLSVHVNHNTTITGGKKTALVTIDDSTFNGTVRVTTGAGPDAVRIDSLGDPLGPISQFAKPVTISLGAGKDTLQLGVLGQTGNRSIFASSINLNGGPGFDILQNNGASTYKVRPALRIVKSFESKVNTFETIPPTVSSANPSDNATGIARNQKIAVTFSEAINPTTINTTNIIITAPGGVPVLGTIAFVGITATFTPNTPLAAGTTFTVAITTGVKDLVGNALAPYTSTFTTGSTSDTTAPSVISTDPTTAATNVPTNKKIAATFSEPMDPSTLTTSTITLTAPGGASIAGTIAYSGTTMTFTPANPLAFNTAYTLTLTTGAKDLAGNPLTANVTRTFTTGSTVDAIAPLVLSTSPSSAQTNVAINKTIAATFSESIDPVTLTTATFTLTAPGNTPIAGTTSYDAASNTATFKPTSNLPSNTTFTATLIGGAAGVKDLAGNPLLLDKSWTFTTGAQVAQSAINLGSVSTFAVMATSSITSTGPTVINGDVGLNPGSAQGIPPAQVNGTIHIDDQAIINAQSDLLAAYNDAVSRSLTSVSLPGNMGGLTFTPGLYTNSTSVLIQGAGPSNNVTLDAQGDPNAIFIFKMGSTLTTGPGAQVILAGGAKASNVFWQVGTSATLDTTTIFKGNILAAVTITVNNGSVVEGRLLAGSNSAGSVTINASTVTVPNS